MEKTLNVASISGVSGAYTFKLEVIENSTSVTNNTSSVTVNHYAKGNQNWEYSSHGSPSSTITVEGSSKKTTAVSSLSSSWKKIGTWTGNIAHNADGTKSISVSVGYNPNSSTWYLPKSNTISATVNLSTIPRKSTITVPSSVTIGANCAVTISRAASSFTHTIKYSCGSWSVSRTGKTTSDSYTIPMEVCNQIPKATSGTMVVTCYTYSGSTLIGSTSKNVTLTVPTSVKPTFTYTIAEAVSGLATQFGAYVRNKSKATVTISASGAYGSTIKAYSIKIGAQTYGTSSATSGILSESTTNVQMTITDSRGRAATQSSTISAVDYTNPSAAISVARCTADGTLSSSGTYAKIAYNYNIAPVNNKNSKSCVIQWLDGETWTTLETLTAYSGDTSVVKGTFSANDTYQFRIVATDYFTDATVHATLRTAFTLVNYNANGHGIAFGKVSEINGFECALAAEFKASVKLSDTFPQNAIIRNAGDKSSLWYTPTGKGSLYATETNGAPQFGTLPVTCGGTGAVTVSGARDNLGVGKSYSSSSFNLNDAESCVQHPKVYVKVSELDNAYHFVESIFYVSSSTTNIRQIAYRNSNAGTYTRYYYNSTWSAWTPVVSDSGWKTLSLTSSFTPYGDVTSQYRKSGNVVNIRGAVSPSSAGTGSATAITISTLPAGYRPAGAVVTLHQGSDTSEWTSRVESDGTFTFSRYKTGSTYSEYTASTWLPFNIVYMTE